MKFRKKPIEIEAVQWNGMTVSETPDWIVNALFIGNNPGGIFRLGEDVHIHTSEGVMIASPNDWIIRGVKGELYPCKPDIFEATYEVVSEVVFDKRHAVIGSLMEYR